MGPVRVGVIGVGGIAVLRHLPAYAGLRERGEAEVVALCDVDAARARTVAAEWSVPVVCADEHELLARPDIDAVSICTPNVAHYAQALAALRAGKHVMCEKPLAMTVEQARELTATARQAGLVTGVNFRYRWIPAALFVTDLLRSGALGRVYHGIFDYLSGPLADPERPMGWRTRRAEAGSGALGDLGSHLIDLAAHWLGEARRVDGRLTTYVTERPAPDGGRLPVDVDDAANFTIEYENGAHGHFLATRMALGRGNYQRIELYGSQGAVSYTFDKWDRGGDRVQVCLGGEQARFGGFSSTQVEPAHLLGTPIGALLEFVAAIRAGREAVPSFADGLRAQEIMAAIEASAANGQPVELATRA
jgi:predicted dehydrogenase